MRSQLYWITFMVENHDEVIAILLVQGQGC
jgi:hypothetical protein